MTRLSYWMLAGALAAAGCAARPQTEQSRAADANYAACRARTDAIYDKQNRYLLSERSQIDTPFSASGMPGNTAHGLSRQYQREANMQDCMDNGTAALDNGGTNQGILNVGPSTPASASPNAPAGSAQTPPPARPAE